jgi:hypothetical protein
MSRAGKVVAALVCSVTIAAGWLMFHVRGSGSATMATEEPAAQAQQGAGADRHGRHPKLIRALLPKRPPPANATPPRRFAVSAPWDRLDLVVAEVKPAAEAGDPAAMRTLGEILRQCSHVDMRSDGAIEADAARESLDVEYMQKKGVAVVAEGETDPTRMAVRMAQTKERVRDSCSKIPAEELQKADDWIAKAAVTGDEGAGLDRIGGLIPRIQDKNLPAEERERLRAQMNEMLQDEIARGHCGNMLLNMFWQDSHDPMLTYIYGGILANRGIAAIYSMAPDKQQAALDSAERELRKLAAAVPPDQLAAAEATRNYIEANYCANWQY